MAADGTCLLICSKRGDGRSLKSPLVCALQMDCSQQFSEHPCRLNVLLPCCIDKTCVFKGREGQNKKLSNESSAGMCVSCNIAGENGSKESSSLGQRLSPVEMSSPRKQSGGLRWAGGRVLRDAELRHQPMANKRWCDFA